MGKHIFVLKNSVHGTEFTVTQSRTEEPFWKISECRKVLCENPDCKCGCNELGMVGQDNPDVEYVRLPEKMDEIFYVRLHSFPEITPEFRKWLKSRHGVYQSGDVWYQEEYYGITKCSAKYLSKLHEHFVEWKEGKI